MNQQPLDPSLARPLDQWIDALEGGDSAVDSLIGEPTRDTTSDVASIIAAHYRERGDGRVVQEGVFPVGVTPIQGAEAGKGPGAIRVDTSYVSPDKRRRVNVEVDDVAQRSRAHQREHLAAMRTLVRELTRTGGSEGLRRARRLITQTQSTFVLTDPRTRQVTSVERVRYGVDNRGRVIRLREQPTQVGGRSVEDVLQSGMLDRRFVTARRAVAARSRNSARPSRRGYRPAASQRFDEDASTRSIH
jgi:hypothetical protein